VDTNNASAAREETNASERERKRAHGVLPGAETRASEARTPILRVRFVLASGDRSGNNFLSVEIRRRRQL
jgi:hypothetical protein